MSSAEAETSANSYDVMATIITSDGEYLVYLNASFHRVADLNADTVLGGLKFKAYAVRERAGTTKREAYHSPINTAGELHLELNRSSFLYLSAPVRGGAQKDLALSTRSIKQVSFYQEARLS